MSSFISEMPGPDVDVNARAPSHDGADHHADRGQLVLGLQDAKLFFLVSGSRAVLLAEALERVHHRRRRRDRVPRADGRAGVHGSRAPAAVLPSIRMLSLVASIFSRRIGSGQSKCSLRVVVAERDAPCGSSRAAPASSANFSLSSAAMIVHVDVEQRRQRAGVGDVLHQDALAHALEGLVAHLGERHAEEGDVRRAAARRRAASVES